jgi:hypothetical protein
MKQAKLIILFLLLESGVGLMINFEKQLGLFKLPILIVITASGFFFFKLLIEMGWGNSSSYKEKITAKSILFIFILFALLGVIVQSKTKTLKNIRSTSTIVLRVFV